MVISKCFAKKLRDKGWTIGNESRTWAFRTVSLPTTSLISKRDQQAIASYRVGGRKGTRRWRWLTDSGKGQKGFETAEAAFVHAEISNWGAE